MLALASGIRPIRAKPYPSPAAATPCVPAPPLRDGLKRRYARRRLASLRRYTNVLVIHLNI
jgi:hypothetical protein